MDLKSDFHITGQLMETPPEYSQVFLNPEQKTEETIIAEADEKAAS